MTPAETSSAAQTMRSNEQLRSHPAVRYYALFSLSALFVMVVCLAGRRLEWWCLAPAAIGCLTLLTHWKHGPPLVLLSLAGLLGLSGRYLRLGQGAWSRSQTPSLMDLVLCIAVLAYVVGHYRLVSLTRRIFPPDPRRPKRGEKKAPSSLAAREADLVTVWEKVFLWFVVLVWGVLAGFIWTRVIGFSPPLDMPRDLWQLLLLVWACLAVLTATGIAAGYLRRTMATPEESLLYLQDQCWRQTRGAQSILNRWLTWARLRAQRKKESS